MFRSVRLMLCASYLVATNFAYAFEYHVQPFAGIRTGANDNRRLVEQDPKTIYQASAEAGVRGYIADETSNIYFSPKVRLSRYEGDSGLNADEYWIDSYLEQIFSRSRFRLDIGVSDVAAATSELTDTGNLLSNTSRRTYFTAPSYSFFISENLTWTNSASVAAVNFDDNQDDFTDYEYYVVNSQLDYSISDRTTWIVDLSRSIFVPDFPSRSESFSYRVGLRHSLTDSVVTSIRVGRINTEVEAVSSELFFDPSLGFFSRNTKTKINEGGRLIDIMVEKTLSRGWVNASFESTASPSGEGRRNQTDTVRSEGLWRFSESIYTNVIFRFRDQTAENSALVDSGLRRYVLYAGLSKQLNKNWRVSTRYHYRRQERPSTGVQVDAHEIMFAIDYNGAKVPFPFFSK